MKEAVWLPAGHCLLSSSWTNQQHQSDVSDFYMADKVAVKIVVVNIVPTSESLN